MNSSFLSTLLGRQSTSARYGVMLLALLIASALTQFLRTMFGISEVPFLFFFGAVMVSGWYGGLAPGFLAIVITDIVCGVYFMHPEGTFVFGAREIFLLILFSGVASGIVILAHTRRDAINRLAMIIEQRQMGLLVAQMGTWSVDAETYFVSSDNLDSIFNMTTTADARPIEDFLQQVHVDDRDHLRKAVRESIEQGKEFTFEYRIVNPDGSFRWIASRGDPIRNAQGKVTRLVGALYDITDRRRAENRAATLQQVTAALSDVLEVDQIGKICIDEALKVLGGMGGVFQLLTENDTMFDVRYRTGSPLSVEQQKQWQRFPVDASQPLHEILRTKQPIWFESAEETKQRYPAHADIAANYPGALALLPVMNGSKVIGVLTYIFKEKRTFNEEEREVIFAISQQCAQSLDRARLYDGERQARIEAQLSEKRWSYLAEASAVLASSLNYEETLKQVAFMGVPEIGTWSTVQLLRDNGTIEQVALAHTDPAKIEWAHDIQRRYPTDPNAPTGIPQVIRSGNAEFYPALDEEALVASVPTDEQKQMIREIGFSAAMILPLIVDGKTIGALQFVSAERGRRYTEEDFKMGHELARRAALAIQNARLYAEAAYQRERFEVTLSSIGDAVIATDTEGCITFINPIAQELTGWDSESALGEPISSVFRIINEYTRDTVENPVDKVLESGAIVGLANHTILIAREGTETPIDDSGAPIRDASGTTVGVVLVFRDIAQRRVAEQRAELLQQLTESLSYALTPQGVADAIIKYGFKALGSNAGMVVTVAKDRNMVELLQVFGYPEEIVEQFEVMSMDVRQNPLIEVIHSMKPMWIENFEAHTRLHPRVAEYYKTTIGTHAVVALPLIIENRVIGSIGLSFIEPQTFDNEDRAFMLTIADQCAQALDRARLSEQAREGAAIEERQRLARDLHDAVSQTLFAATSMAEGVRRMWQRNPNAAAEHLEEVVLLNRGAMAEMRTLLLELRPEGIRSKKLSELLEQLIDVAKGRKPLAAALVIEGEEARLPDDVQIALYRITQESINNMLKYSQATQLDVRLSHHDETVTLLVQDNGQGFDPELERSGMGLSNMRERADGIGAQLAINSGVGRGTSVQVTWKVGAMENRQSGGR